MKRQSVLLAAAVLAGCNYLGTSHEAIIQDPLAQLPGGERILYCTDIYQLNGMPDRTNRYVLWERPGVTRRLQITHQDWLRLPKDSAVHVLLDGNHAWITNQDTTIASFDFVTALAILDEKGQPDWATAPGDTSSKAAGQP